MFESEFERFNFIIEERTAARIELDRVLMQGHVPERYQAVKKYVDALDKCIELLPAWNDEMMETIQHIYREGTGTPPKDEPAWVMIRERQAWTWITSLKAEKREFEQWLVAIDSATVTAGHAEE